MTKPEMTKSVTTFVHARWKGIARYALAFSLILATSLAAQAQSPASLAPEKMKAGSYATDPAHTQIQFGVNHLGFNVYYGLIGGSHGVLNMDPANPASASVEIEIPLADLVTTSSKLNAHLRNKDFFEVDKFPTARFKSTRIEVTGQSARIVGDLTIKGVTKPVTLEAKFTGAGTNPMNSAPTMGFEAHTMIRRSEFGIDYMLPVLGDEVDLRITAAFEYRE